jgi:hypothetical protein
MWDKNIMRLRPCYSPRPIYVVCVAEMASQRSLDMKFVIADPKDSVTETGVFGQIDKENVYLTAYAQYPDKRRPQYLAVGECIENVKYSLCGSTRRYNIVRVA